MLTWMNSPIAHSALAGMLAAAAIDFQAFRAWKSWKDATTYAWSTAIFRWVQGAVVGAATAVGLGVV